MWVTCNMSGRLFSLLRHFAVFLHVKTCSVHCVPDSISLSRSCFSLPLTLHSHLSHPKAPLDQASEMSLVLSGFEAGKKNFLQLTDKDGEQPQIASVSLSISILICLLIVLSICQFFVLSFVLSIVGFGRSLFGHLFMYHSSQIKGKMKHKKIRGNHIQV